MSKIIIIGASLAGHNVAVKLREKNKDCSITLVTEEVYPFYDKRRLAEYLSGQLKEEELFLASDDFYLRNNISFLKESEVIGINAEKKRVFSQDKPLLEYDFLVICTGRSFILPEIPGVRKKGVFNLNALRDFKEFLSYLIGDPVCLVGSGSLLSEIARILAAKQKEVKLISFNNGYNLSQGETDINISEKIEIINTELTEIIGEGQVQAIKIKEGKVIGVLAVAFMGQEKNNIDFLKNSGIELYDGYIVVDDAMRTNLSSVYSCGSVCLKKGSALEIKSWDDIIFESLLLCDNLIQYI